MAIPDGYNTYPSSDLLGTNDADNVFVSSSVVANADGSLLERMEYVQGKVGTPAGASVSADIAAIKAQTDELGAAVGASISADIAAVKTEVDKIGTPAGADVSADIAAIKAQTDELGAAVGASISADIAAVKTEVDKLGTPAGADVSADIAAIKTEVDKIGTPVDTDVVTDIANVQAGVQRFARKTVTFTNTNADVPLFTVTGTVLARVFAVCITSLASAGTCNIGVLAGTVAVVATTASTDVAAGEIWHDASPDAEVELASVAAERIIANGNDISIEVEAAHQVDSGVLEFYCTYIPLSAGASVVAA